MTQDELDREFEDRITPWRDLAVAMGVDRAWFDSQAAAKKVKVDQFRADYQAFHEEPITVIVAIGDKPRADGVIIPSEELRKKADGVRYFWNEDRKTLTWRGPASELTKASNPSTTSTTPHTG